MAWIVGLRPDSARGGRGTVDPRDVRQVGVVGCGLMGSGIVEVVARAGANVTFVEGTDELVARGRASVERSVGKAVERGKLDRGRCRGAPGPGRRGVTDLAGLGALRPGDRGGDRGRRGEAGDLPDARRGHAARGRARLEHVVDPHRGARHRVRPSGPRDRDALLQPTAGHGAAGADAGRSRRRTRRSRSSGATGRTCSARRACRRRTTRGSS